MTQISRLKDAEITNGNLINADDLDAEFNQLVNESNAQDTRLGNIENNNVTLGGVKTFTSAPKTNQLDERTADNGVSVDGVLLKDGTLKTSSASDPSSPDNGTLWYNSTDNTLKARLNGQTKTLGGLPSGYAQGPAVAYVSAASVKIPDGFRCRSGDNTTDIAFSGDATLSLASSGANGLDTGSEANSTWYYVWAIADSSGTNNPAGLLSTSSTTPTMPSGYDKKRLLPIALRNDASGNIIPFHVSNGWPTRPLILYNVATGSTLGGSAGSNNVLFNGSATSFTDVGLSTFVPPIAQLAHLKVDITDGTSTSDGQAQIRAKGETHNGFEISKGGISGNAPNITTLFTKTDNTQTVQYNCSTATGMNFSLWVLGYVVTEV